MEPDQSWGPSGSAHPVPPSRRRAAVWPGAAIHPRPSLPRDSSVRPPLWGSTACLPLRNPPTFRGKELFLPEVIYCQSNL